LKNAWSTYSVFGTETSLQRMQSLRINNSFMVDGIGGETGKGMLPCKWQGYVTV